MTPESPSRTMLLWLHGSKSREAEMVLVGRKAPIRVHIERKLQEMCVRGCCWRNLGAKLRMLS